MNTLSQKFTYESIFFYSQKYNIPPVDVLLIALNRFGIAGNFEDKRIRFRLQPLLFDEIYYMAVCVNTYDSPFFIGKENKLFLSENEVGRVIDIEKDTCDTTYYRRNKTELTLNSNMRSQCHGCTFCGTYNLQPDDKIDMSTEKRIENFIKGYLKRNNVYNLSDLVRITICTGCFQNEMDLVNHIILVYNVFKKFGFTKRIRYIGSQICSEEAMSMLENNIPYFSISLTVECFSKREQRMRKEKASLDLQMIRDILMRAKKHNFSTNFLYIVGLDDLQDMKEGIEFLKNSINRFPVVQIMQNYEANHEMQRVEAARNMDFYFQARELLESIFKDTDLRPRSWENYRGLFYTEYQHKEYTCIRI